MPSDEPSSRATLPRSLLAALAIGGGLLLAQLVVLVVSLTEISSTEDHVAATDAKVTAAFEAVQPIAEQTSETLEGAEPLADQIVPTVRNASALVEMLGGQSDELASFLDALPALRTGFNGFLARLFPVLDAIDVVELQTALPQLGPTLANLNGLVAALTERDRLAGTLDHAANLLREVDRRKLVDRAVQSDRTLRSVLAVQRRTLEIQRRTLGIQLRSLRVQLQSLDHVRSLDEKTGGDILSP